MCGHTSIIALFRFELLNYFSIPVDLRISKYLPTSYIGRTNESPGKSEIAHREQQSNTPNIDCRGQSWLMQAAVSTVGQAISRQHVRRYWDAVPTQTSLLFILFRLQHCLYQSQRSSIPYKWRPSLAVSAGRV